VNKMGILDIFKGKSKESDTKNQKKVISGKK
jgi:hypothetical protein